MSLRWAGLCLGPENSRGYEFLVKSVVIFPSHRTSVAPIHIPFISRCSSRISFTEGFVGLSHVYSQLSVFEGCISVLVDTFTSSFL